MSKVVPDPQIQSLRAMRAGDIAFAVGDPAVNTIGKQSIAFAQPLVTLSKVVPPAVESVAGPDATPSESPAPPGAAFATILSVDVAQNITVPATTDALVTIDGPFNESPVVGVAFSTSVV